MGFSAVYKVLQDVFPQVDSRLLRAYAIEHSKDVNVAVEAVLAEIIPTLAAEPPKVNPSKNGESTLKISEVAVDGGKTGQPQTYMNFVGGSSYPALNQSTKADQLAVDERFAREFPEFSYDTNRLKLIEPEVSVPFVTYPPLDADNESDDELIVLKKRVVNRSDNPDSATSVLISEMNPNDNHDQGFVKFGGENVVSFREPVVLSLPEVSGFSQNEDRVQLDEVAPAAKDNSYIHLDVDTLSGPEYTQSAFTQDSNVNSSKPASEKDAFAESFEQEDGSTIPSVLTESNQDCSTELLEQFIEEAKNNKQTLALAMNSVVDLMKEVEVKEKAAEEVKEKAAEGCSHILSKVDELKQALIRAKEANDTHAGEVCAEKAILSTELKELQLRLFTMSDERNKSLAILDEMRQALEIRLASATEMINKAEEEKLEKEKSAREALLFQENQMEKVVEESKKLMLEAEENSKFQEFLMDRGRAIDILQGEISVKCQEVLLLKEKFDLNLGAVGLTQGSAGGLEAPDRIFVGGLPYYFTEAQVRELVESFGALRAFDLVKDRETGNSKGYAFCVYQDPSVTDIACAALNGIKVGDKTLTFRRANQVLALSGSFRSTTIAPLQHESETFESPKRSAEPNGSYGFVDRSLRSEAAESVKSAIETVPIYDYAYGGENMVDGSVDDGWELF